MKENGLYRKETEDLQRKLDKMIADGAESWDLKNAVSFCGLGTFEVQYLIRY